MNSQQIQELRQQKPKWTDTQFAAAVDSLNQEIARNDPTTAALAVATLGEWDVQVTAEMDDLMVQSVCKELFEQLKSLFTSKASKDRKERFKSVAGFTLSSEDEDKYSKASTGALIQLILLSGRSKQLAHTYISFIFPAVLNLCDFHEAEVKVQGSKCVEALCCNSYRDLVKQMRLATVFWEALQPHLSFLPPSTEESIAVPLMETTYAALTKLYVMMKQGTETPTLPDLKLLDELLQSVIRGLDLSYIRTVKALLRALNSIVDLFGKYIASYTTELIIAWTPIMEDPFSTADLSLMKECAKSILHVLNIVPETTITRHALELALITGKAVVNVRKEEAGGEADKLLMDIFDTLVKASPDVSAIVNSLNE